MWHLSSESITVVISQTKINRPKRAVYYDFSMENKNLFCYLISIFF